VEKMMEPSFEKFLGHLIDGEINFIVVGGLAVTLNGYVRLTDDVDILVDLETSNIGKLIESLSKFGEGYGGEMKPSDFDDSPGAIRLIEESEQCQVDIFTTMAGQLYEDLIEETEAAQTAGKTFHYASKAQLIRFKSDSVREKDKIDASALRQLQENPKAFD
jgi:hypothetical protein